MLEIIRRLSGTAFFLLLALIFMGGMAVSSVIRGHRPITCWQCGNHNPPHVAFTTDEVGDATKKHDCKLWHQNKE